MLPKSDILANKYLHKTNKLGNLAALDYRLFALAVKHKSLPPSRGLDTTTPTTIQSTIPIMQRIAAITIRTICHLFILSAREESYIRAPVSQS